MHVSVSQHIKFLLRVLKHNGPQTKTIENSKLVKEHLDEALEKMVLIQRSATHIQNFQQLRPIKSLEKILKRRCGYWIIL